MYAHIILVRTKFVKKMIYSQLDAAQLNVNEQYLYLEILDGFPALL